MKFLAPRKQSPGPSQGKRRGGSVGVDLKIALAVSLAVMLILVAFSNGARHVDAAAPQAQIAESALLQIEALLAEKESRTPAQRKIDSQLVYAVKMNRGETVASGVDSLEVNVPFEQGPDTSGVDRGPRVVVDVTANFPSDVIEQISDLGGEVQSVNSRYNSLRASIPINKIEQIAANPAVLFVQPKQEAMTSRTDAGPASAANFVTTRRVGPGFAARAATVRSKLLEVLPGILAPRAPFVGSVNSEGDTTHRAALARAVFGVTGSGIKIGVLSNGVVSLAASQSLGDLGPVTVLPGQAGTGDEGTAMLEIVHDLAPNAQLFFATAFTSITSLDRKSTRLNSSH